MQTAPYPKFSQSCRLVRRLEARALAGHLDLRRWARVHGMHEAIRNATDPHQQCRCSLA